MTSDKAAKSKDTSDGGFLDHAFKTGINAAESIHKTAFEIPINLLEGMGAPQDKVDMLRDKSQKMIGELYSTINSIAAQVVAAKPKGPDSDSKDS